MANENFKRALSDALLPEFSAMLPEAEDGEHEFSHKFEKKMQKLVKRRNKPYYKLINTVGKRVACIAVIIIVASTVTAMSVEAVRNAVVEFIIKIYEKYSVVQTYNDGNAPETIEEMFEITYGLNDYERACGQKVGHQNLTYPGDFAHKHMNCRL